MEGLIPTNTTGISRALLIVAAAATVLAACSPASQPSASRPGGNGAPPAAPASAPRTLRVALNEEPLQFALGFVGIANTGVSELLFTFTAGLTVFDASSTLQPRLAQKVPKVEDGDWSVNSDGTMDVTWHLKPGATWHDGQPLTAGDYEFAIQLLRDPEVPAFLHEYPSNSIAGVTVQDPQTFVVHWKTPYLYANAAPPNALPPLPQHLLRDLYERPDKQPFINSPYWTSDYVSVGPYKVTRWDQGSFIEGAAFDGYILGRPKIDRIVFQLISDLNTIAVNMLSGDIDMVPPRILTLRELKVLRDTWGTNGGGTAQALPAGIRAYLPQRRDPSVPWADVRVRTAMMQMLDRQSEATVFTDGFGGVADGFIAPDDPTWLLADQRDFPHRQFDLASAHRLMAEAGWQRGADSLYRDRVGQTLTFEVAGSMTLNSELSATASLWRDAGLDPSINIIVSGIPTTNELRNTYRGVLGSNPGGFDNFIQEFIGTAENRWRTGNSGGFTDPTYERLFQDWRRQAFVGDQRLSLQADMLKILADQVAYIPVYYTVFGMAWTKNVHGPGPYQTPFTHILSWNINDWDMG